MQFKPLLFFKNFYGQKSSLGIPVIFSLLFIVSCDKGKNIPDVSKVEVEWEFRRFEQELFALDTNEMSAGLAALERKYPEFSQIYFNQILKASDPRYAPQGKENFLKGFVSHPALRRLYDTVQIVYKDPNIVKSHFEDAFKFYKYYFPADKTPSVTTFLSEYSVAAFIYGENDLAVGLDFFLGSDYPYQKYNPRNEAFSDYLTQSFNKDYLTAKAVRVLAEDKAGAQKGNRLLDFMLHNGKQWYFTEQILPYANDTIITEMSEEKTQWLKDNEREIYAYLLDRELLYSTDYREFNKLINPSPVGNSDMPREAPGQAANYLGWRIVKSFMARNPELTLADLMAIQDAQEILDKARYKPL